MDPVHGQMVPIHTEKKSYGNYYTVPSDVAEGYAVEELSPGSEYYDFDLTKAKIAYAIDGISYSDIELTQVSSEALIGMTDDIAATYDLVYIGGDISALDRDLSKIYDSSVFAYIGPSARTVSIRNSYICYVLPYRCSEGDGWYRFLQDDKINHRF